MHKSESNPDKASAQAQWPISSKHYPGGLKDHSERANAAAGPGYTTNYTCPCKASIDDELVAGQPPSIWATYVNAAERYEGRVVDRWNNDMDSLLIFAGLFTAVITAFVVYVIGDLGENYAQTTANMLRILAAQSVNGTTGQLVASPPFDEPDSTARSVNIVWFLAIILSVAASTGAMLCKLWCTKFRSLYAPEKYAEAYLDMTCNMQKQSEAMKRWKMKTVVEVLPGVLHIAVELFFIGLWKYLQVKDAILGFVVGSAVILVTSIYVVLTVIPLIWDAPFSTPFTPLLSFLLRWGVAFVYTSWINRISNALLRWVIWLLHIMFFILLSPLLLIPTLCMALFMATFACFFYLCSGRAKFYLYEILMFFTISASTARRQTNLQVNALVRLLYIPLKYDDVCGALRELLQLATSGSSSLLKDRHVLECAKTCLWFVMPLMREDGIVKWEDEMSLQQRDLFFYCTRILSFNRISQAKLNSEIFLADLPDHTFFDKLLESKSYTGSTNKEVQLLCDSLWLRPSQRRGKVAIRWAYDHLRGATKSSLSDTVFIELIRNAEQWLRITPRGEDLPLAYVQSLELAPVPSTKVILAALPYFYMLMSPSPVLEDPTISPSHLIDLNKLIVVLRSTPQNHPPKWICQVICAIWSNDPQAHDQSTAKALLNWVATSLKDGSLDNLLALLNAITYGPKVLPTETVHPLSTLSDIYTEVAKRGRIPTDSQGRDVLHLIVQAYAATFEYAFENSNDQDFAHVKEDFEDSFESIAEYLKPKTRERGVASELTVLSTTFFTIVTCPDQGHPTLSPVTVRSFKAMMRNQGWSPQASLQLRWICSIVRAALRRYPHELEDSVAEELATFASAPLNDTLASAFLNNTLGDIQVRMEAIIHVSNILPMEGFYPLTTISRIYKRITMAGAREGLQPQFRGLYHKVLRAYISIVKSVLLRHKFNGGISGYEEDVKRSMNTLVKTITWVCVSNQDRNLTLLTIYPLALLFWRIKPSSKEVNDLLKLHKDSLIDLFIETSSLSESSTDLDAIECDLDIKFYCAKLLFHLFANDVRSIDGEKIRKVLLKLEPLSVTSRSPRVRWKAIYLVIQMEYFYDIWWDHDMKRICRNIVKDLRSRMLKKEAFADDKWHLLADSETSYLIPYLKTVMEQVQDNLLIKEAVYHWIDGLPLLWPHRRPQRGSLDQLERATVFKKYPDIPRTLPVTNEKQVDAHGLYGSPRPSLLWRSLMMEEIVTRDHIPRFVC